MSRTGLHKSNILLAIALLETAVGIFLMLGPPKLLAKSEAFLRQMLAEAGVNEPAKVPLEMPKYLDDRGGKKLKGEPVIEMKDAMNLQDMF